MKESANNRNPFILLVLLALCGALASCATQTLTLSTPPGWQFVSKPVAPRWVVAYPASHTAAIAPLKRHRSAQGYEVISLPSASSITIASKISALHLGRHEGDCLLLVGSTPSAVARHDKMAGHSSDNRYSLDPGTTTPLFPIGRFPTAAPAETAALVHRILAFEELPHIREAKVLVGNPMGGGQRVRSADLLISSLSRTLMRRMDSSWQLSGAADVSGHPFSSGAGGFRSNFREALDSPYTVGTYFGHSSAGGLCYNDDGVVFGACDWSTLDPSSSRGLFLSCGCYTVMNNDAVGPMSVRSPGGPIAYIGATGESYAAIGYLAAKGLTVAMSDRPPATVGGWWMEVQRGIATESLSPLLFKIFDSTDGSGGKFSQKSQRRFHLEMWTLLGDPATQLL